MTSFLIFLFLLLFNSSQDPVQQNELRESIAHVDSIVKEFHKEGMFNGVVLLAKGDTVLYTGSYGKANFEWIIPHSLDSRFRIASITKAFTAVLTLKLIEENYLNLDDVITDHISDYPSETGDKITIKHLLNQTAGIPDYLSLPGFMESEAFLKHDKHSFPDYFKDLELEFEPGSDWDYGNSEYYLLGLIIENVTGTSYEQAMEKYILGPAELLNTGFVTEQKVIPNYSGGYIRDESGIKVAPAMHPTVCFSAGMMYSTALDLNKFIRVLYRDKKLLSDHFTDLMTTQLIADYGFGIFTGNQFINGKRYKTLLHMGEIHGCSSQVSYFPETDYSVIILDNTQQCPAKLYFEIKDLLPDFHSKIKLSS